MNSSFKTLLTPVEFVYWLIAVYMVIEPPYFDNLHFGHFFL